MKLLVLDGNNYMNGYLAEKSKTFKKSNELVSNYFHSYYYKGKYGRKRGISRAKVSY